VSTGTTGRETPAGVFAIIEKDKDHHSTLNTTTSGGRGWLGTVGGGCDYQLGSLGGFWSNWVVGAEPTGLAEPQVSTTVASATARPSLRRSSAAVSKAPWSPRRST
jgi:hypothetical protein